MTKKTVAIVGVLPPPYGGISVHVERLCGVLDERELPYVVYEETTRQEKTNPHAIQVEKIEPWSIRYLLKKNEAIIHNHFLRWKVRFFLSLLRLKGKRVVHTIHSLREDNYSLAHSLMIYLTGIFSHHFIVVNEDIKEKLLLLKIPENKISVIPAFIKPLERKDLTIPSYVDDVFANYERVIVANGGIGNLHEGEELYGLDLCINMFKEIAATNEDVAFLYFVTHVTDEKAEKRFKELIKMSGLTKRFFLIKEKMPLYPLLKKASLFVRPTRSDGDAISIREALYYGIPVVASDVVTRPRGVYLFEHNKLAQFVTSCEVQLNTVVGETNKAVASKEDEYVDDVIRILYENE